MTRLGADPHDLRDAATRLDAAAAELRLVQQHTVQRLADVWWAGPDAVRFRHRWHRWHHPALRAAELACSARAQQLRRHAAEQLRASEPAATATGSAGPTGPLATHRFEPLPRRVESGALHLDGGVELLSLGAGVDATVEHLVDGRRRVIVTDHVSAGFGASASTGGAGAGEHIRGGPERTRTWTVDADDVGALLVDVALDHLPAAGAAASIGLAARMADVGLAWLGVDTPLDAIGPPPAPDATELLVRAEQGGSVRLGGGELTSNGSLAVGVRTGRDASSLVVAWSQDEQVSLGGSLSGQLCRRLGISWTPPAGTQLTGRIEIPMTALGSDPPAGQLATIELTGQQGHDHHTIRAAVSLDAVRAAAPTFPLALEQLAAGRPETALELLGTATLPPGSVAVDVATGRIESGSIDLPFSGGLGSVSPGVDGRVLTRG